MNENVKTILIVGVGGQGTLLASRLLGNVLISEGYDVKISEVHGMSQRGGSVVTYVRYGEKVDAPISDKGVADIVISFEQLEAARWLPYLKKGGTIITSTQQIDPMPVVTGAVSYPEDILDKLRDMGVTVVGCDALSLAQQAGSSKATNVALLGVTAKYLGIDPESFKNAIKSTVKPAFIDINLKAFELGMANN
jgi:indolepyruvate ferredoxin oxidoreductase beta subunit